MKRYIVQLDNIIWVNIKGKDMVLALKKAEKGINHDSIITDIREVK